MNGDPKAGKVALRAIGLRKNFGDLVAVDGIDLEARAGECLGVLGPNGAGKTTTIEMLEGLLVQDAGRIEVLGRTWGADGDAIRQRIGVQLQETQFLDKLSCYELLRLFGSFYDKRDGEDDVLARIGLTDKRDVHVSKLSGGQKQRLAIGCALLHRPRLLFLDEPTTGLDPQARRRVWEIIEDFKVGGGSVVLTTHYMEEAERLADDLLIIDHGKVIASGAPETIIATLHAENVVEFTPLRPGATDAGGERVPREWEDAFRALDGVDAVLIDGASVRMTASRTQVAIASLFACLDERELGLVDLRTHRATLEDVFLSLTGKHLRDD